MMAKGEGQPPLTVVPSRLPRLAMDACRTSAVMLRLTTIHANRRAPTGW